VLFPWAEGCYVPFDARTDVSANQPLIAAERALLQRLCETGVASVTPDALNLPTRHSWAVPDHHTIFEALIRLSSVRSGTLRDRLPAEATRMGFPDVAWDKFFTSPEMPFDSRRATNKLIDDLLAASKHE
jgi:hypothetical protein